ncbi:uncharacterized protein BKA55DRAFT_696746 [Fusarium redolens]|uniref:SGNH hydrolase-type esterase domain-containing protein n=1 Tax=Fusarium redolens TaxID=48865 RepID=A0A9P9G2G8_FUSRE|nr:uncharacterized protein BKA55DRAFT_696746 [Fusarium redolens]KAH7230214.1 hypothetical protein BKA55DRAFT_696746 [Fusarium redolens]
MAKKGSDIVYRAYQDALRLGQNINPFLLEVLPDVGAIEIEPGVLEDRYYGDIRGTAGDNKKNFIRTVFRNIATWYPFDWIWGQRIEVYCEVDQPNKSKTTCKSRISGKQGSIGAYALSEDGKYKIILSWYATAEWFSNIFGYPDPTSAENAGGQEDDWSDLYSADGSSANNGGADEEPDYDDISEAEAIAFAAGDYTPNGWLQTRISEFYREEVRSYESAVFAVLTCTDSITYGYASSDGNGYRAELHNILTAAGNKVDMIGSVRSGSMEDNDNEGHSGDTSSEIASFRNACRQRPNVVLLHAGTNDMNKPEDPDNAPGRLDNLVGTLVAALPDATIVVARIIPAVSSSTFSIIRVYNNAITRLMARRALRGEKVMMVGMPSGVQTRDLKDGWIKDPVSGESPEQPSRGYCPHEPTWLPQGEVASGGGLGVNLWLRAACFTNQPVDTAVHFADLNGDGRADLLWVDDKGAVTAYINSGSSDTGANAAKVGWLPPGVIANGVGANRSNVHFADLNGDGRVEYFWVHDDGSVGCWLNAGGPDNGPNAGKVSWIPQGKIASGIGKDGDGVRFADLNDDDRAGYLYVNTDGSGEAYLNLGPPDQGPNAGKVSWASQGTIESGVGMGRENVVLADVNGDERADYVVISRKDGSAKLGLVSAWNDSFGYWDWWHGDSVGGSQWRWQS